MWRISKFFKIPLNDERMQDMSMFDIEFYELSMIADDPKKLEQLQEHYYDSDFDEWLEEFELEQAEKQAQEIESSEEQKFGQSEDIDLPDKETIEWSEKNRSKQTSATLPEEEYEISVPTEVSDWEEVKD